MSDYLTSLAARALGVADVARPRHSLFEPRRGAPEPVAASEPAPPSSLGEVAAEGDEAAGALPPVPVPEPAPRPLLRREEPPAPEAPAKPSRREPLRIHTRLPSAELVVAAVTPESAAPPPSEVTEPEPAPAPAEPPVLRRGTDQQVAREPLLSAQPPRGVDRPQVISPPTVRVTIGRVDVRAVVPEHPPEPKRKPRPAPRMSLDEYLSGPRSSRQ